MTDLEGRRVDLALEELLGGAPTPDLRYRILAATRERSTANGIKSPRSQTKTERSGHTVLVASVIAYAFATVAAIAVMSADDSPRVLAQDPSRERHISSVEQLRGIFQSIKHVTVDSGTNTGTMITLPERQRVPIKIDKEFEQQLIRDLGQANPRAANDDVEMSRVLVHLDDGSFIRASVNVHQLDSIVFPNVGKFPLSPETSIALRHASSESENLTYRRHGIVLDAGDLNETGPAALSRSLTSLRLLSGEDADLAPLSQYEALEHLDLAAAIRDLSSGTLRKALALPRLRSLVLHPNQVRDKLELFDKSSKLRRLSLTAQRPDDVFNGRRSCATCHQATDPGPRKELRPESLDALLRLRELRHIGLHGVTLPTEAGNVLSRMPRLESLDLRRSDLRELDIDALQDLPLLRELDLANTIGLDDAFVEGLESLKSLRRVDLRGTDSPGPTQAAIDRLKTNLPDCEILVDENV